MRTMPALVLLLLAGCTCRVITAHDYLVLRVVDGDTFKVHYDGEQTSVRFIGIDAPELTEAGGPKATAALERLVGGRVVRLEFAGERKRDNFGRLLCRVYVDGVDVGAALVTEEHATWQREPLVSRARLVSTGWAHHTFDPIYTSRLRFDVLDSGEQGPVIVEIAALGHARDQIVSTTSRPPLHDGPQTARRPQSESSEGPLGPRNHWALVIGLSVYSARLGLDPLAYAAEDARAVGESLAQLRWRPDGIKLITDDLATLRNVKIAVQSWLSKVGPDDLIVVFWSGHGFVDPEDPVTCPHFMYQWL